MDSPASHHPPPTTTQGTVQTKCSGSSTVERFKPLPFRQYPSSKTLAICWETVLRSASTWRHIGHWLVRTRVMTRHAPCVPPLVVRLCASNARKNRNILPQTTPASMSSRRSNSVGQSSSLSWAPYGTYPGGGVARERCRLQSSVASTRANI